MNIQAVVKWSLRNSLYVYCGVMQRLADQPHKLGVVGSNPTSATKSQHLVLRMAMAEMLMSKGGALETVNVPAWMKDHYSGVNYYVDIFLSSEVRFCSICVIRCSYYHCKGLIATVMWRGC